MKKFALAAAVLLSVMTMGAEAATTGTTVSAGQKINFGNYWQTLKSGATSGSTTQTDYNKDAVTWRVLVNNSGTVTLLSDKALYADAFNDNTVTTNINVWSTSQINATLNNIAAGSGFLGDAFTAAERGLIVEKTYDVKDKDGSTTESNVTSKLYLLDYNDVKDGGTYGFSDNASRKAQATDFAKNVKVYGNGSEAGAQNGYVDWWLRSPFSSADARIVNYDGVINYSFSVNNGTIAVRPALDLNLQSIIYTSAAAGGKSSATAGSTVKFGDIGTDSVLDIWMDDTKSATRVTGDVSVTKVGLNGGNISIDYNGAKGAGNGEYVSALFFEKEGYTYDDDASKLSTGTLFGYGKGTASSGTSNITIGDEYKDREYHVEVFNENGVLIGKRAEVKGVLGVDSEGMVNYTINVGDLAFDMTVGENNALTLTGSGSTNRAIHNDGTLKFTGDGDVVNVTGNITGAGTTKIQGNVAMRASSIANVVQVGEDATNKSNLTFDMLNRAKSSLTLSKVVDVKEGSSVGVKLDLDLSGSDISGDAITYSGTTGFTANLKRVNVLAVADDITWSTETTRDYTMTNASNITFAGTVKNVIGEDTYKFVGGTSGKITVTRTIGGATFEGVIADGLINSYTMTDDVKVVADEWTGIMINPTTPEGAKRDLIIDGDGNKINGNGKVGVTVDDGQILNLINLTMNGFSGSAVTNSAGGTLNTEGDFHADKVSNNGTMNVDGVANIDNLAMGNGATVKVDGQLFSDTVTAIGSNNTMGAEHTYAFGNSNTVSGNYSFALGNGTTVSGNGSVALGVGSTATEDNVVSVGSETQQRKIVNVAAGTVATDAATFGQVKNTLGTLTFDSESKALTYTNLGDENATEIDLSSLAGGVDIFGTDGEITVTDGTGDDAGKKTIGLAGAVKDNITALQTTVGDANSGLVKDIADINNSVVMKSGITAAKVTAYDTYVTSSGLNANSKEITNVKAGTKATDAANMSQIVTQVGDNLTLEDVTGTDAVGKKITLSDNISLTNAGSFGIKDTATGQVVTINNTGIVAPLYKINDTNLWDANSGLIAATGKFGDKVTISASGIVMGSQKISGLANGTETTDAVNKGQLDAAVAGLSDVMSSDENKKLVADGVVAPSTTERSGHIVTGATVYDAMYKAVGDAFVNTNGKGLKYDATNSKLVANVPLSVTDSTNNSNLSATGLNVNDKVKVGTKMDDPMTAAVETDFTGISLVKDEAFYGKWGFATVGGLGLSMHSKEGGSGYREASLTSYRLEFSKNDGTDTIKTRYSVDGIAFIDKNGTQVGPTITSTRIDARNTTIANVGTPIDNLDAANKDYVDTAVSGVSGNVTALAGRVTANETNISNLQGAMSAAQSDITTLQSSMTQAQADIALKANAADVYTKAEVTGLITSGTADAVVYDDGSEKTKITLQGATGTTITNLKAGVNDTDAVNVKQMNEAITERLGKDSTVDTTATNATAIGSDNTVKAGSVNSTAVGKGNEIRGEGSTAIGNGLIVHGKGSGAFGDPTVVNGDNSYSVGNNNYISANNSYVFGSNVGTEANPLTATNSVVLGNNSFAKVIPQVDGENGVVSVGAEGKERRITNVRDGVLASDAATYGQLERAAGQLSSQIDRMGTRISKVGAGAAALAALHPLDFDPENKLAFSAGVGNYRSEKAAAVGMFYRPTDRVMFSMGATVGNDNNMVNAGVTFALDRKIKLSNGLESPQLGKASRETLVNEVQLLAAENTKLSDKSKATEKEMKALKDKMTEQDKKIAKLLKMIEELKNK